MLGSGLMVCSGLFVVVCEILLALDWFGMRLLVLVFGLNYFTFVADLSVLSVLDLAFVIGYYFAITFV